MKQRVDNLKCLFIEKQLEAMLISRPENISYLSAFTGSSGKLLITKNNNYLITDSRYIEQATIESRDFNVVDFTKSTLYEVIKKICKEEKIFSLGIEGHYLTYNEVESMKKTLQDIQVHITDEEVETLRWIKEEEEIKNIKKAEEIGDEAFSYILTYIKQGMTEKEVALELEFYMKRNGATGLSFDSIVASGINSSMPHAKPSNKKIEHGDFIKMDFGCIYNGYCSDMTRTIIMGKASERQKEIYNIVLEAQEKAIAFVKEGVLAKELDAVARNYISSKGYGDFFGHGLGHGLGLYIHESPTISPKGDMVLKEGMVITIEPGIYIPKFGGVRIEDVVVVKKNGCTNLTTSSKELIVL